MESVGWRKGRRKVGCRKESFFADSFQRMRMEALGDKEEEEPLYLRLIK